MDNRCPECGAEGSQATCEDNFHQFLYWEQADMERLGVVHHLMVLSYYLQHPSLYSPDGLAFAQELLVDFVARGITPAEIRRRERNNLDSGKRSFSMKGTPEAHGTYHRPLVWTMRASDVVAGGKENYVENVRAWAQSICDSLAASGNLTAAPPKPE